MRKEIAHEQKGEYLEPYNYCARSRQIETLFDRVLFNSVYQPSYSRSFDCFSFRNFTMYLHITSNAQGAHLIDLMPQFNDNIQGEWCDFPQGLFAALGYSDAVAPVNIHQCFTGPCAGRQWRLRVIETDTDETHYFTVTARVEFWS